jgi:hypothetical protein
MRQILKWTGLILLAAAVGLVFAFVFTAGVQRRAAYPPNYTVPFSSQNGYRGWGMMNGRYWTGTQRNSSGNALTLDQAVEAASQYLAAYGNPDLTVTEVMEFTENFYAEVEEKSSGIHAFELLIDRYTGAVYPEPGPNMMWNIKYGHMGGSRMMGGWGSRQTGSASVTAEQALDFAQQWLDQNLPGTLVAEQADAFYGYYTIHVMKDGQVYGMLSVNDYTGEAWYHTWHGNFVEMKELEE